MNEFHKNNHHMWMIARVPFEPSETTNSEQGSINDISPEYLDDLFYRYPTDIRNFKELCIYEDMLKEGKKILEIGTHVGAMPRVLLSEGKSSYYGIEHNERVIEYFMNKMKKLGFDNRVNIYNTSMENFSTDESLKFDYITSYYVFEHLQNPLVMLDFAKKWLKDDGKLVIGCPNVEGFFNSDLNSWRQACNIHLWLPGLSTLTNLLTYNGFKIDNVLTYGGFYPPNNILKKMFNKFLKKINKGDAMTIVSSFK